MLYKSMVLQMLESRPELHEQLRSSRQLLLAMERYALELKASHESWMDQIAILRPGSDASQISSEALEIALQELQERLPADSPPNASDSLSLDAAMAYIRTHTPPA